MKKEEKQTFKKLNLTEIIEKSFVPVMNQHGFSYKKGGRGQVWRFVRSVKGSSQEIWLQRTFSPFELFLSVRSIREPFLLPVPVYSLDKDMLDKGPPIPWKFLNESSLMHVVNDMIKKVESILVPFLDNDINNPEANSEIYRKILEDIKRREALLAKLNEVASQDILDEGE